MYTIMTVKPINDLILGIRNLEIRKRGRRLKLQSLQGQGQVIAHWTSDSTARRLKEEQVVQYIQMKI
jgi:hypothetical protein